jgi:hypothetical protein
MVLSVLMVLSVAPRCQTRRIIRMDANKTTCAKDLQLKFAILIEHEKHNESF